MNNYYGREFRYSPPPPLKIMKKICFLIFFLLIGCSKVRISEPPIPIGEIDPPMVWENTTDIELKSIPEE